MNIFQTEEQCKEYYLRMQATISNLLILLMNLQFARDRMLAACGMTDVLTIKLERRIGRADNLEVWL
jgi:hypothetical protein